MPKTSSVLSVQHALRALSSAFAAAMLTACPSLFTIYADREGIDVEADVPYVDDGRHEHRCDIYTPRDLRLDSPSVVFFHGGYWTSQDKQYFEPFSGVYGNVGVALGREGIAVANCNYRLFPEVKLPGMLNDVEAAVAMMRNRRRGAPVAIMGHSAGAHLASAAPLLPNGPLTDVDAMLLISGLFDIENGIAADSQENRDEILIPLFGETAEEQRQASTIDALRTTRIPTLIVAGDDDLPGIVKDFAVLSEDLVDSSIVSLVEIADADHAGTVLQIAGDNDEVTPAVVDTLRAAGLLD
jgi:acetyl esterase/lipase